MVPPPTVLGLVLCDLTIVEQGTTKVSLVGMFTKLTVKAIPSRPRTFFVFAALTDGSGNATITLTITRLDTDKEVFARDLTEVHFPDKLEEVELLVQMEDWSFPAPGWYEFTLLVDGEWVARRRLEVILDEE